MYQAELRKIFAKSSVTILLVFFLLCQCLVSFMILFTDNRVLLEEKSITSQEFQLLNTTRIKVLEEKLLVSSFAKDKTFSTQTINRQVAKYKNLEDIKITATDESALSKLVAIHKWSPFALLFLVWLSLSIFKEDNDDGFSDFIRALPAGRTVLVKIKIILLTVISLLYAMMVKILPILILCLRYGPEHISRAIQSNFYFRFSALKTSVARLVIYDVIYFILIAFYIVALSLFIISLTNKKSNDLYIFIAIITFSIGLYVLIPEHSRLNIFKYANIIACSDFFDQIAHYKDLGIGNIIISRLLFSVIFILFSAILFLLLAIMGLAKFQKRGEQSLAIPLKRVGSRKVRTHQSLLSFELDRIVINRKWILIVAIPIMMQIALIFTNPSLLEGEKYYSLQRISYVNFIEQLSGEYTEEKEAKLEQMIQQTSEKSSSSFDQRQIEIKVLSQIKEDFAAMRLSHENMHSKLYVLDQNIGNTRFDYHLSENLLSVFWLNAMIMLSVLLIGSDNIYSMDRLLETTPSKFCQRGYIHFCMINGMALLVNIIYSALYYYQMNRNHLLIPHDAAIQSFKAIRHIPFDMTIGQLELFLFFRRYICLAIVALISYYLIKKCSKLSTSMFLISTIILFPAIIKMFMQGYSFVSYLPWSNLLGITSDLKSMSGSHFILDVSLISLLAFVLICSMFLFFRKKKKYANCETRKEKI